MGKSGQGGAKSLGGGSEWVWQLFGSNCFPRRCCDCNGWIFLGLAAGQSIRYRYKPVSQAKEHGVIFLGASCFGGVSPTIFKLISSPSGPMCAGIRQKESHEQTD